jgi:hypothetical protein
MDGDCFTCKRPLGTEVCIFDCKYYHKSCCQFCKNHNKTKSREPLARRPIEPIFTKEKTPSEAIPELKIEEPKRPTKVKSTPGRLNFAKFEILANMDVKCYTCKLTIYGQRFLSKKIGQFNCLDCHVKLAPKCHMCKITFETGQSVFKDEHQNKYCEKCINIHYDESKKQKLEEQLQKKHPNRQQSDVDGSSDQINNNEQQFQRQESENTNDIMILQQNLQTQTSYINSNNGSSNNIKISTLQEKQSGENSNFSFGYLIKQQPQVAKVAKKSKSKSKSKSPIKSPHNSSPSSPVMSPKTKTKRFKISDTNNYNNNNNNNNNKDLNINKSSINITTNIQNSKQCYACSKSFTTTSKVITFKENQYHDKCFACKSCKKSLINQAFHQDKKDPNFFTCDKCNNFNNRLKKCTICYKRLFDWDSFLIDKYQKTYCTSCFTQIKNKACVKCLKAFEINQSSTSSLNKELKQLIIQIDKQTKKHNNNDIICSFCD